jgi:hypothetical protein
VRARAALLCVVALAACSARRVDISERPPSGFVATARAEPGERCDAALRKRATDEATYHCEVRGRSVIVEGKREEMTPQGCVLSLAFSCGTR